MLNLLIIAASIVFSNETETIVWNPKAQFTNGVYVAESVEKYGAGTLEITERFDAVTNSFTVYGGRLKASAGSNWPGEYYSVIGSLHNPDRMITFMPGTVLEVVKDAVFGGIGAYCYRNDGSRAYVNYLFDNATIEFNRQGLIHHFGATTFNNANLVYSQRVKRLLFTCNQRFSGTKPYTLEAEQVMFSMGCRPKTAQCKICVDDITEDWRDDLIVQGPLTDVVTYREDYDRFGINAFCKTGKGTMCLAGASTTTGLVQVAEGILAIDGTLNEAFALQGGFLAGTGTVGVATIESGGGFCLNGDGEAEILNVTSLNAKGEVRLSIAGGYGRHLSFDHHPFLRIVGDSPAIDFSKWRVLTCFAEVYGMEFSYSPETGLVSVSGEVDVPSPHPPSPGQGLSDYYDIDWERDTLAKAKFGNWQVEGSDYQVSDGWLAFATDGPEEEAAFHPNEQCNAQPYATFTAAAKFHPIHAWDDQTIADSAAGMIVRLSNTGEPVYCGASAGKWVELFGATPTADESGVYNAEVTVCIDERSEPALVSYLVNGQQLHDASGEEWLPRCGSGRVEGEVIVKGTGKLGNVLAERSDSSRVLATRSEDGEWTYFGTNSVADLVAANKPYYIVLPEGMAIGSRYLTKLSTTAVPSVGLRVWPTAGMLAEVVETNGEWRVTTRLVDGGLDFTIPEGERVFVSALPSSSGGELKVSAVEGEEYDYLGGELIILGPSSSTFTNVRVGEHARLTICGQLGPKPISLSVALGGVFDASAVAGGQEVNMLAIDCLEGFGSMCGVKFAKTGTLSLTNLAAMRTTGMIACDLSACLQAANVLGWVKEQAQREHWNGEFTFDGSIISWRNRRYPDQESAGWRVQPMFGGGYMQNVVFTSDPNVLYAYADVCGPFRSDDAGLSWQRLGENLSLGQRKREMFQVRSLSVDPRDPDSVVALAGIDGRMYKGGFMVSRNGGKSWRKTGWTCAYGNGKQRMFGTVLDRDPNDPDTLVGGEDWHGIFLSRDNGETWVCAGLRECNFTCIRFDRKVKGRVYACSKELTPDSDYYVYPNKGKTRKGGLFVSEDSGASWRQISDLAPIEFTQIEGDDRLVGIFNQMTVKVSSDGGLSWSDFSEGLTLPTEPPDGHGADLSYAALGSGTNLWLTGTGQGALYRRYVGDAKWTRLSKPSFSTTDSVSEFYEAYRINRGNPNMDALNSFIVDPNDQRHWFTTDWFTIWETKDDGASFTSRNVGISQLCSFTFEADPLDENNLSYGVHDMEMVMSRDGGQSYTFPRLWTKVYGGNGHSVLPSIAYSPFKAGTLFVAGANVYGDVGIGRSTDGGVTWDYPKCVGLPRRSYGTNGVNTVTFRAGRTNEVWACVGGVLGDGEAGPYVSYDNGENWQWMGEGMDVGEKFYTVDSRNGGPIHPLVFSTDGTGITTSKENSTLYRWIESERKWVKSYLPNGFSHTWKFHAMEADPFTPGRYLYGGYNGIAESLDGGATWKMMGAETGRSAQFAFDPNTPGLLVLAGDDGVRVSWDYGKSFSLLDGGLGFDTDCYTVNGSYLLGGGIAQITVNRKRIFIATESSGVHCRTLTPPNGLLLKIR